MVLKSIRSQWFGQTDVIFERLRRVTALEKVVIFVDEADTQFDGSTPGGHEPGATPDWKDSAMMSDPRLRGRDLAVDDRSHPFVVSRYSTSRRIGAIDHSRPRSRRRRPTGLYPLDVATGGT
ncbi:MAG: hypothetical protein R3C05_12165 [Pirellulaceae bacterium]